jgi:hypothetical protein
LYHEEDENYGEEELKPRLCFLLDPETTKKPGK